MLIRVNPILGMQFNSLQNENGRQEESEAEKIQNQPNIKKKYSTRPASCFQTVSREKLNQKVIKI